MSATRKTAEPGASRSEALTQIREATRNLLAEGRTEEALDYSLSALAAVLRQVSELELELAKLRRERLGKRSERVSADQLALLLEELQAQLGPEEFDRVAAEQEDAGLEHEIEAAEKTGRETGKPARKRSWQTRDVERKVHHVAVPEEERTCAVCGRAKRCMGEDVTRTLAYVPAHFVEHEYHREKYACGACKEGVSTAPGPARIIERSVAEASALAHIVVSKYADHTPLHRLNRIFRRSGVDIAVSTLADWVAGVAERVEPLVDVLSARVLQAHVVRTDATGLKVLDPKSPENIERGTIWCYVGDDRDVVFRYTPTGEGETGPWEFLAKRRGYIQADAANVFDRLFTGAAASAVEVGCWAHGRRRFVALADTDVRVAYPLRLIRRLYRLEELADVKQLDHEERAALRNERTRETLDRLKRWLIPIVASEPPASDLTRAAAYCLNQWDALTRFLDDGRLSPDNNLCERQLRDVALGRKNFLFAGSHAAAHRTAVLYSLMRTCAQHGVEPLPWLTAVLRKLAAGWDESRLEELLPDRWNLLHRQPGATSDSRPVKDARTPVMA